MKINKKKVMVSALAVAMGAALVGSISGTIAWYQYSTRVTTAMVGTSAGVSRNLQIRLKGEENTEWRSEVTTAETTASDDASSLRPITTKKAMAKTDALTATSDFVGNPVYQEESPDKWIAAKDTDYAQYTFEIISWKDDKRSADNVFLSDLTIIQKNGDTKKDISDAIRVHISASVEGGTESNFLLSKNGQTIDTHGALDLNNDNADDMIRKNGGTVARYDFQEGNDSTCVYGGNFTQAAYNNKVYDATENTNSIIPAVNNGVVSGGTAIGTTAVDNVLTVVVTIWIEGWQELTTTATLADGTTKNTNEKIWSAKDYIGSVFNVGASFVTNAVERA